MKNPWGSTFNHSASCFNFDKNWNLTKNISFMIIPINYLLSLLEWWTLPNLLFWNRNWRNFYSVGDCGIMFLCRVWWYHIWWKMDILSSISQFRYNGMNRIKMCSIFHILFISNFSNSQIVKHLLSFLITFLSEIKRSFWINEEVMFSISALLITRVV